MIAAVIFVAAGTFLGMYQSFKLKRREEYLIEILQLIEEISVHIRYKMLPVEQLIVEISGGKINFINNVSYVLEKYKNNNWRHAWETAANEATELNGEDRGLLISVGKQLGNSDLSGQLAMLELNKTLFTVRLSEAAAENSKKAKMYRSVGLLAGIGAATMII